MSGRTHIVLVPGFGGFDAFGSVRYYAGTTEVFQRYVAAHPGKPGALHYFDNLPTAGVETRAKALKEYLVTRFGRGEIAEEDRIVLVGHSTGGLDIRRLIESLADQPLETSAVDGSNNEVENGELLRRILRVVFLSVPHRGTNIADWVDEHQRLARIAVHELREVAVRAPLETAIAAPYDWLLARVTALRSLEEAAGRKATTFVEGIIGPIPGVLLAAMDVGRESGRTHDKEHPWIAAQSRQIRSDVLLWLENMDDDFLAITDLMSIPEIVWNEDVWKGIGVKSYATIGNRPAAQTHGHTFDIVYRAAHAVCAKGPFQGGGESASWLRRPSWASEGPYTPASSDNDGIVNTASMFFPGAETTLVLGDHGDVIGHYRKQMTKDTRFANTTPTIFSARATATRRTTSTTTTSMMSGMACSSLPSVRASGVRVSSIRTPRLAGITRESRALIVERPLQHLAAS